MSSNSLPLFPPQRQSPVAIIIIFQRFFKVMIRSIWPLVIFYFVNPAKTFEFYITIIAAGVIFLSSLRSFISYFTFYFHIENDELIIREGLLNKTNRNIPFDRIQTINFTQTIVHQFFNVVSLDIDTAGSKGNEFSIKALRKEKAEQLRSYILSHKKETETILSEENLEVIETTELETEEPLLQLSVTDLLKIGVSQNHLRTVGIILAFFLGLSDYIEELMGKDTLEQIKNYLGSGVIKILFLSFLLVIVSFIFSLIRTVLRYYNLVFLKTKNGFKIKAGLFTRQEQSAQLQKVQLVQWSTNPIKKYFGMYSLYLRQAASNVLNKRQTIYVPGCYEDQIQTVRQTYFTEELTTDFTPHQISPLIIGRHVLYFGLLPMTGLILLGWLSDSSWRILLGLCLPPIVYLASRFYHQRWQYDLSEEGLRTSKGVIGQDAALLRWNKVQGVTLKQSIYQRRKNLADLTFYTAGGKITLPYIELEKANAITNFVLYRVEQDTAPWM